MSSPFPAEAHLNKPVCVFCGSSPGSSPIYTRAAESIGQALARAKIPVVYGGGRRGIMGVVSQATLKAGGYVHGILPRALMGRASEHTPAPVSGSAPTPVSAELVMSAEGVGKDLLEDDFGGLLTMEVVGSMHERKAKMARLSTGGFVVLPGGYGTFEEVLEMITWNQLGIHKLPIVIVNVGNFFAPLLTLFENAVAAGFIKPENLSLMRVLDLSGGQEANASEEHVDEWGPTTVKALQEWVFPAGTGYDLAWNEEATATNENLQIANTPPALFTTMRYTSPDPTKPTLPISKQAIPLLDLHFQRLHEAYTYFSQRDGQGVWGDWPGTNVLWNKIRAGLEREEERNAGDWRVRVVYNPGGRIEVQVVPAPVDAGPFQLNLDAPLVRRRVLLDPENSALDNDSDIQVDYRIHKTIKRDVYDSASERGGTHPEVLLHTSTNLLETNTSNIAMYKPDSSGGGEWITPRIDRREAPFLNGVMRRYLLSNGVIREGSLLVGDWTEAKEKGWRVIGFNGFR